MNIKERFGKNVRKARLNAGISQETLAHLAQIDRTYVPSIEKGERNVSIEVAEKIAIALKIDLAKLFE